MRDSGALHRPEVAAAFRKVPRERFLPGTDLATAYTDEALVTRRDPDGVPISSSSQPSMMAIMLEQLAPAPGDAVLEIGAGTGYNAALLAELVGDNGRVVTIDIDPAVVAEAREHLAACGYHAVQVRCADGVDGDPEGAPYDRIIATVGVPDIAPAWTHQLAPGGRLVLPLDLRGPQCSVAFERRGDHLASVSVVDCGFVRLRGPHATGERIFSLRPGVWLRAMGTASVDVAGLAQALDRPTARVEAGSELTSRELFGPLGLRLSAAEPGIALLIEDAGAGRRRFGGRQRRDGKAVTPAVIAGDSMAVLWHDSTDRLVVAGYGPGGDHVVSRVLAHMDRWDAAGRQGSDSVRIEAYPPGTPVSGTYVIDKPHSRLLLTWPGPAPRGTVEL